MSLAHSLVYILNSDAPPKYSLTFPTGIHTSELDTLSAETCFYMSNLHPDYSKLASRIEVSNLHKETDDDYLTVLEKLDSMTDK